MREIKFRAWDGEVMVQPAYGLNNDGHIVHSRGYDSLIKKGYATTLDTNRLHIMQFTGLFDKNGVEIYEADIVLYSIKKDTIGNTVKVEWTKHGYIPWMFENRDDVKIFEVEVVGNVHENPELWDTRK